MFKFLILHSCTIMLLSYPWISKPILHFSAAWFWTEGSRLLNTFELDCPEIENLTWEVGPLLLLDRCVQFLILPPALSCYVLSHVFRSKYCIFHVAWVQFMILMIIKEGTQFICSLISVMGWCRSCKNYSQKNCPSQAFWNTENTTEAWGFWDGSCSTVACKAIG